MPSFFKNSWKRENSRRIIVYSSITLDAIGASGCIVRLAGEQEMLSFFPFPERRTRKKKRRQVTDTPRGKHTVRRAFVRPGKVGKSLGSCASPSVLLRGLREGAIWGSFLTQKLPCVATAGTSREWVHE